MIRITARVRTITQARSRARTKTETWTMAENGPRLVHTINYQNVNKYIYFSWDIFKFVSYFGPCSHSPAFFLPVRVCMSKVGSLSMACMLPITSLSEPDITDHVQSTVHEFDAHNVAIFVRPIIQDLDKLCRGGGCFTKILSSTYL